MLERDRDVWKWVPSGGQLSQKSTGANDDYDDDDEDNERSPT